MDDTDPSRLIQMAVVFEATLGAGALAMGWLVGHWPLVGIGPAGDFTASQVAAVGWGLVAAGPLLAALVVIDRVPWGPLRELRNLTAAVILKMFGRATVPQLAVVAMAAGCGEELLFRGLVQAGLAKLLGAWYGPWMALALASVLFGVCHWLNTTYAILAMLAGAYFGSLLLLTGSLWTPIVAHAAYDFIALVYLVRSSRAANAKS